jgi:RimJ/RimL family protein N-acetyltransferase
MTDDTLKTDRLHLRPIGPEDTDLIWPYVSDPVLSKFMSWAPHTDKSETRNFLERLQNEMNNGKSFTWAIFLENTFCGIISLIAILKRHRALTYNRAELAYWLGKEYQHQGIMTEAGDKVIEFAFNGLGLHRLVVSHVTQNNASERLIKRWQFKYIGTEHEAFQKNNIWYDHKLYELLVTDRK